MLEFAGRQLLAHKDLLQVSGHRYVTFDVNSRLLYLQNPAHIP